MRICIIAEGSYPYVRGGVSNWIDLLVRNMPEHDFVIQTIAATRADKGKFKYDFPKNIVGINEVFLQDDDRVPPRHKFELSERERDALRSIIFGRGDEKWGDVFDFFDRRTVSVNDLLMGIDFFNLASELYDERYSRIAFTDFLWTLRSVFLPIFTILKSDRVKADVYHAVSTGYAGILACAAGHRHNKPVLLTEHGIYTREREEEIIRAAWTKGVYKDFWIEHFYMLSRCIYERAYRVLSLFETARHLQIELGCPAYKTQVIPNGIRLSDYENLPQKNAGDDYINIGAILRITPIKDVKTMINAFSLAKEQVDKMRLYIIGGHDEDPYYYEECLGLIEMLGVKDVIFTGFVNPKDYIGKMDIVILTSISEGQPLSILEAMAAGKPCIVTRVGDCADMLRADDEDLACGISCAVMSVGGIASAMVHLAENPLLRSNMGTRGRALAESMYDVSDLISRYRAVYRETRLGVQTVEGGSILGDMAKEGAHLWQE